MFQVELKKSEDSVTGRMGLSWVAHCTEDFGFKKIIDKRYTGKKGSNWELEAYQKRNNGRNRKINEEMMIEGLRKIARHGRIRSFGK